MAKQGNGKTVYGKFSKDAGEFIIGRYDTPRPWLNCIHNEVYGLFFSQIGQGYSFYRDALRVRINYIDIFGYVPTHPQTGKFIYLRDVASEKCWPAFPMHTGKGYRAYRCTHGQGYSHLAAARNQIAAGFRIFVPASNDPVEIWQVTLRNTGPAARKIAAFAFQEWQLTAPSGITDTLTYTRATWRADLGAIVARMTNPTTPLMYDAFMAGDFAPDGFDCSQDAFSGTYNALGEPAAVLAGACTNSSASGERMCGALSKTFEIPAGGEVAFTILTGVSLKDEDVARLKAKYLAAPAQATEALEATKAFWGGVRSKLTCQTPVPAIDVMANSCLKYQTYLTARWCRGSKMGYRDVLQDMMGFAPLDPVFSRRTIAETLKYQFASGLCLRGYDPVGGKHDTRLHRDSPIWIPLALSAYVRETGDLKFLDEQVAFYDGGQACVFDHALTGLRRLYEERGMHGLCLIGDGDWNDSIDEVARKGKGVSVWLTIAAVYGMQVLSEIARAAGRGDTAGQLDTWAAELTQRVNDSGWDGRWYVYAFTDEGRPVGSDRDPEGKVHLNAQTWAIFTGIAQGQRLASVLDVIDNVLDTKWGPVLIHPAYTRYVPGIGKVSGKNPGMAENGPIYSHGVTFKMLADLYLGRGEQAFASYMKIVPCAPDKVQKKFQGEPFAGVRYLVGPSCPERFGASPYSHFTGSPAWSLQLVYERMLGVRPEVGGLRIDPCIPAGWKKFEVVRPFRGDVYRVRVRNPKGVQRGVRGVSLDGRKLDSTLVPIVGDGREHLVEVSMG